MGHTEYSSIGFRDEQWDFHKQRSRIRSSRDKYVFLEQILDQDEQHEHHVRDGEHQCECEDDERVQERQDVQRQHPGADHRD